MTITTTLRSIAEELRQEAGAPEHPAKDFHLNHLADKLDGIATELHKPEKGEPEK